MGVTTGWMAGVEARWGCCDGNQGARRGRKERWRGWISGGTRVFVVVSVVVMGWSGRCNGMGGAIVRQQGRDSRVHAL